MEMEKQFKEFMAEFPYADNLTKELCWRAFLQGASIGLDEAKRVLRELLNDITINS